MRNAGEARPAVAPVLTLFLLAPLVGEVLGAALRLSYFVQPLRVLGIILFYGAGVVLIREVARRLGLSWLGVALLALAFALIEEGLALQTIFNPAGPGEDTMFGRVAGVNLFWAVVVCGYHIVWSVLIPIALAEHLFPQRAGSTWLSKRATAAVAGLFLLGASIFLLISFLRSAYRLPPTSAAATLLLTATAIWTATRCLTTPHTAHPHQPAASHRTPRPATPPHQPPASRRTPRPATVAWFGLLAGAGWFVLHVVAFTGGSVPVLVWIAIAVLFAAASVALLKRWTRSAWTPRHLLALAFGLMLSATLFGVLLVFADARPENTIFQLTLLLALPVAYQVRKRRVLAGIR